MDHHLIPYIVSEQPIIACLLHSPFDIDVRYMLVCVCFFLFFVFKYDSEDPSA